jgi:hypothetical protein
MFLPILNNALLSALLSADLQRLTNEHVAEPCHVPDTLSPNNLPLLVNASTYSKQRPVVGRLAACCRSVPCPRYTLFQWFASLSQCFYLFCVAPYCWQTCSAWLTNVLQSCAMSQMHSVSMICPSYLFWVAPCCRQTWSARLTSVLHSCAMSQIHSVPMICLS